MSQQPERETFKDGLPTQVAPQPKPNQPTHEERLSDAIRRQDAYYRQLDNAIIGQEQVKRVAANVMYQIHARAAAARRIPESKSNLLFIGPSGSGKTLTAKTMARISSVPTVQFSLPDFSSPGYIGASLSDAYQMYADNVIEFASTDENDEWSDLDVFEHCEERKFGIMFFDEIDKLTPRYDFESGGFCIKIQNQLLTHLEGTTQFVKIQGGGEGPPWVQHELSTDDLTFICSGAFEGLEDIIAKRTRTSAKKATLRSLYDKLVASDLIEYGINPQLLGRFDHILTFDELKVQDLIDALIKPKDSPLNVQRQMLEEFYGTSLLVDHDVYEHIASIALHNKALGARALRQMSKELLAPYVSHLEHYARKGTLRITLPMAREMLARYENLGEKEAKEIGFE